MLVRHSIIYAFGNVTQAVLAVGLISLYTRVMSKEDFGEYALVLTNVQFAYFLVFNWICVAFMRLYQKAEKPERLLGTFLGLYAVIAFGGLVLTAVLLTFLDTRRQMDLAVLGYFFFLAMAWMEINMRLYQARLEAVRQARARIARAVVTAFVGGGLAWIGWGPYGALIGAIAGSAGVGFFQSIKQWRGVPFGGSKLTRRELWIYGMPLAISFAIGTVSGFVGRYIIIGMEGVVQLGIYVLAVELATRISNLALAPISAAMTSITVHDLEKSGVAAARESLRRSCILMFGMAAPGAAGLIVVSPDVGHTIVGEEFREGAIQLLPYVGLSLFLHTFRSTYLDQALHLGMKSTRLMWWNVLALIVAVPSGFYFISAYGLVGATYAGLLLAFIGIVFTYFLGRSAFPLPFPLREMGKIVVATLVMTAAVLAVPLEPGPAGLFARVAIGIMSYSAVIYLLDVGGVRDFIARRLISRAKKVQEHR